MSSNLQLFSSSSTRFLPAPPPPARREQTTFRSRSSATPTLAWRAARPITSTLLETVLHLCLAGRHDCASMLTLCQLTCSLMKPLLTR